MVGHREVLLHLIELARQNGVVRVLLAVHRLGFQRGEEFRERQRHGVGAQCLEAVEEHVVLHHAQLDAVHVFELVDRALAVGEVAEAVLPVHQAHQALFLQLVHHLLAHGAVQHHVGLFGVVEQERRVPDRHLFGDAHQRGGGAHHHLLRTANQGLLHLQVRAQRCRTDGAHTHLAARGFFHLFGKQLGGAALVGSLVEPVAEADDARLEVLGSDLERGSKSSHRQGGQQGATESFHGCLHWQRKERHRKKKVQRRQRIHSTGAVTICGKTTSSARIST